MLTWASNCHKCQAVYARQSWHIVRRIKGTYCPGTHRLHTPVVTVFYSIRPMGKEDSLRKLGNYKTQNSTMHCSNVHTLFQLHRILIYNI